MKNRVSGLLMETGVIYNKLRLHRTGYFAELMSTNEEVSGEREYPAAAQTMPGTHRPGDQAGHVSLLRFT
jgi:hypothetical protein